MVSKDSREYPNVSHGIGSFHDVSERRKVESYKIVLKWKRYLEICIHYYQGSREFYGIFGFVFRALD